MDPYEVLGVSEDADEETIKKAYRTLVKKYHPDRYVNNPLSDLAAEKIKEINKAYDTIMNNKNNAGNGGASYGGGQYRGGAGNAGQSYSGQASFQNVRILMSQSRIREAMAMLEQLPRTAEWYYLSGCARLRIGWYDQALSFLRTAVNMEPDNAEYRSALDNVTNRNRTYTTNTANPTGSCCCGNGCTDCCTTLLCIDCICPCF